MRTTPYMTRDQAIEAFRAIYPDAVNVSAMWKPGPSTSLVGPQPGTWEMAWEEHHTAEFHEADLRQ